MKYLFLSVFVFCSIKVQAQITYDRVYVDYDSAWQYKNLRLIPIRQKKGIDDQLPGVVSLSQAIQKGYATISERGTASTENVHFLRINNNSDKSVFISSGELIAGGRQDRMIAKDTILVPTGKDQYVPVMCVEEGRWTEKKEKKFVYSDFANNHLRKALDLEKNQVLIWREINSQMGQGDIKSTTLAYLSRNVDKKLAPLNDEYFKYFQNKFRHTDSTIVGFVCVSGNRIIGCDIFATSGLFYGQLEPLLKGYTDEAVFFGAPVSLPDKPVKEYMDKILTDEKSQEEFVKYNGKIFRQDGKVIHINTF